jgi:protocatechuate 3,4-dioxygenase beta subunit
MVNRSTGVDNLSFVATRPEGQVRFTTIFPGWYTGRLAHIHLKTVVKSVEWTSHVTQLYLPQDVERVVYGTDAYRARGSNPIEVNRDFVVRGDTASVNHLTLPLLKHGDGYQGEYDLAVSV